MAELPEPTTAEIFDDTLLLVREFWEVRNREYAGSWCRHGLMGAILNLFRKTDRLSVWLQRGAPAPPPVDTIFDAAAYACAILAYVVKNHPLAFETWLTEQGRQSPAFLAAIQAHAARPMETPARWASARVAKALGGPQGACGPACSHPRTMVWNDRAHTTCCPVATDNACVCGAGVD